MNYRIKILTKHEVELIAFLKKILTLILCARPEFKVFEDKLAIVGGWVRDKLINRSSNDVDLAIHPDLYNIYKNTLFRELSKAKIKYQKREIVLQNKLKRNLKLLKI